MDKKHHILTGLALTLTLAFVLATGIAQETQDVEPMSNGEEYDLSVDTLSPVDVRETEATFRATVDELDNEFDAALVYWNYSTDSSLDEKGPINIALNSGETVERLQPGLETDAGYDVEAYTEPIVWDDETLSDNFIDNLNDRPQSYESENFMENIAEEQGAMEEVSESETAMEEVSQSEEAMEEVGDSPVGLAEFLGSPHVTDTVWNSETASETFWEFWSDEFGYDIPATLDDSDLDDYEFGNSEDSRAGVTVALSDSPNGDGKWLDLEWAYMVEGSEFFYVTPEIDFSDVDEMEFEMEVQDTNQDVEVRVGDETVFSTSGTGNYEVSESVETDDVERVKIGLPSGTPTAFNDYDGLIVGDFELN